MSSLARFLGGGTSRRIPLFFVLCFALATIALGIGASLIGSRALSEQLDVQIANEAAGLAHVHATGGVSALKQALERRDDRGVNPLGYLLRTPSGAVIGGELRTPRTPAGWHDIRFDDGNGVAHDARALTVTLPDRTVLTVAAETAPTRALIRTMMLLFAGGLGVVLLVGVAGGLLLGRVMRQRLDAMTVAARAIIGGDLGQRIPVSEQRDEFDRLALTLNEMLERIGALVDNLRQVSGDLAHDLRTPIVHLRQRLETALAKGAPDSACGEEIEQAIEKADAILSLFAAILRISEVESGTLRQYFTRVDLSAAAALIGDSYGAVAEDSGRRLLCAIAPGIAVTGDGELLAQALVNLVENAVRHTAPGAAIRIVLARAADGVLLAVEDDGPGIPAADRPRLLRRFTRLESARTMPGYGLGLSLVSAIAAAHGGRFTLEDNGAGLAARIRLPAD